MTGIAAAPWALVAVAPVMGWPVVGTERKRSGYLVTAHMQQCSLPLLCASPQGECQNVPSRSGDSATGASARHLWLNLT